MKAENLTIAGSKDPSAGVTGMPSGEPTDIHTNGEYAYEENDDGGITIIQYIGNATEVAVPDEIDGKSVTEIGWAAFSECTRLTSITIPDSVTEIGWSAFSGCKGLTNINVDEKNRSYSSENGILFDKSKTFLSYYPAGRKGAYAIPDGVTSIGPYLFFACTGLTNIIIPDGVTKIGECAFSVCTGLTSITIPDSVTKIERDTFFGCSGLISITIPDSVTEIGLWAFYGCTGLTSVNIPDSVTEIGDIAFGYYYDYDQWDEAKVKDFTIYGKKGTAAETYANENGFRFVEIEDDPL